MNLIEGLQQEANRRREILKEYEAIGPNGAFGAWMLKQDIQRAEELIASGDIIEMLKTFKTFSDEEIG